MNRRLNFQVWLRDRTQRGFANVTSRLRTLQREARITQKAWTNMGVGAGAAWAVGQTMQGLTGPAREMNAARGELHSLLDETGSDTLNKVQWEAMKFASSYGQSASEFVRASYDIQSAISGLNGTELAKFTSASAILATATKADTATITSYMGTMYGVFKTNADKMGKAQWVEKIAGQTAVAVKMFKTTGSAMNEAFSGLGSRASNQNISSAEQFAILGMAQAGKTGSTAGTAYAGFMDALPNAQNRLKLNFAGDDGKALGMVAVIDKLKSKLGDELSVNVVGHLNSAFGTVASGLIQDLWHQTDVLGANISSLDKVNNMDQATLMARRIADPWSMLGQTVNNVRVIFGQALDTALMPTITFMTSGFKTLQQWMIAFPKITAGVAWLTFGLVTLGAVVASVTLLTGAYAIAKIGLKYAFYAFKFVLWDVWKALGLMIVRLVALTVVAWGKVKAGVALTITTLRLCVAYIATTRAGSLVFACIGRITTSLWAGVIATKASILSTLRLSIAYISTFKGDIVSFIARMTASLWAGTLATKALAVATFTTGKASLMAFGSGVATNIARLIAFLWSGVIATKALAIATFAAGRASLVAFSSGAIARIVAMSAAMAPLLMGMISLIPAAWSLAVAFFAAIGWVPVLITAIVIGVGLLVAKWDEFTAAFGNTKWFKAIAGALSSFMGYLGSIGDWFKSTWSSITGFFSDDNDLKATIDQQVGVMNSKLQVTPGGIENGEHSTIPANYAPSHTQNQSNSNSIGVMNINTTHAPGLTDLHSYMSLRTP
ncbi:phage tail tape measure protein [Aliivibrio sp. S2TY2]|uniref:phage tail tape measure protein n=1 Tax=unclassified Aliivibrio TaxID=2645654 RepID=UPI0023788833|nr:MULTISPECIES: phage tail tape measure protein [unclassified Aliivibrio]MDD9174502.1 phage tail tape measure protein [Aliivibrio sp. S3TY1]MDD9191580.1 phage tail tape measure protein [Aliivibrio sp. S2TY2]